MLIKTMLTKAWYSKNNWLLHLLGAQPQQRLVMIPCISPGLKQLKIMVFFLHKITSFILWMISSFFFSLQEERRFCSRLLMFLLRWYLNGVSSANNFFGNIEGPKKLLHFFFQPTSFPYTKGFTFRHYFQKITILFFLQLLGKRKVFRHTQLSIKWELRYYCRTALELIISPSTRWYVQRSP